MCGAYDELGRGGVLNDRKCDLRRIIGGGMLEEAGVAEKSSTTLGTSRGAGQTDVIIFRGIGTCETRAAPTVRPPAGSSHVVDG